VSASIWPDDLAPSWHGGPVTDSAPAWHPSPDLDLAVTALESGDVVALPTDTVYGLAVDPTRPGATASVFALKGRPGYLELPVLVADLDQADELAGPDGLSPLARALAVRYWPGPLTIVVPRRAGLDWALGGDDTTIGLRCPAHDVARWLCARVGPLATTSANRHGVAPLNSAADVRAEFGDAVTVVDGASGGGVPSTVVAVTGAQLTVVRAGAVTLEDLAAVDASASASGESG
jgi:L-threonylcarbamoyladenylate synthase